MHHTDGNLHMELRWTRVSAEDRTVVYSKSGNGRVKWSFQSDWLILSFVVIHGALECVGFRPINELRMQLDTVGLSCPSWVLVWSGVTAKEMRSTERFIVGL